MLTGASSASNSISGSYVTEDIWFEIFLHLPLDSIFKFRCVSKLWFSILSNPSLLTSWYKLNDSLLPWGIVNYAQSSVKDRFRDNKVTRCFTIAYPDSHSNSLIVSLHQKGFALSFLNSIFPNRNDARETYIHILGSSNGLILCATAIYDPKNYYVCNPLTKKWVSLPPPPSPETESTRFICSTNECDSVCYKVIRIQEFENAAKKFKVEIFSSDSGEWNIYDVSSPQQDATWYFSYRDNFVTHNGFCYWMRRESSNIVAFSVDRNTHHGTCVNECSLIDLPDRARDDGRKYKNQHLGESEGLICYARINYTESSLSIWVLDQDWYLVHNDTKFHDTLEEMVPWLIGTEKKVDLINEIQVLGFSPVDKHVVILRFKKYIWTYDTRTNNSEQLLHPSFMSSNVSVSPLTISAFTFVLKTRPTMLPPVSRRDT